jgi:hypothetical protein
VPADAGLHCGQANARAFEVRLAVQALQSDKQFAGMGHIEPGAVVSHEINFLPGDFSELDPGLGPFLGIFPGVADPKESARVHWLARPENPPQFPPGATPARSRPA